MDFSFRQANMALANASLLVHAILSAPISLDVDASASHVGAVLQQMQNRNLAPFAIFSQTLSDTEARYSTFDGELLGSREAYLVIRHIRFLLKARQFQL